MSAESVRRRSPEPGKLLPSRLSAVGAASRRHDTLRRHIQVETFRPTRPLLSGDAPRSHAGDPEAAGPPIDWGSYSFLNIKRYRQYFNVDTYVRAGDPRAARPGTSSIPVPTAPASPARRAVPGCGPYPMLSLHGNRVNTSQALLASFVRRRRGSPQKRCSTGGAGAAAGLGGGVIQGGLPREDRRERRPVRGLPLHI